MAHPVSSPPTRLVSRRQASTENTSTGLDCENKKTPLTGFYYNSARETGRYEYRRLEINSDASESWHSFSSNGRWLAFSSKRLSHVYTRTFFAYLDAEGRVHKPFVLPQKDPLFYDSCLWTFSVPELVIEPIRVDRRALAKAIRDTGAASIRMPVTMATPQAGSGSPYTEPLRE